MKAKTALASVAMLGLALAQPAAAAANSAAPAAVERASAISSESEATGGSGLWLVFAALGLSALFVVLLTDGSNAPVSP